jgi:hypothetical protein
MTKRNSNASQRNRRNTSRRYNQAGTDKLVHQICSVSDPFCSHAIGAKSPTITDVGTYHYQYTTLVPLVTGDTGWAFMTVNGGGSGSDLFTKWSVDTTNVVTMAGGSKPATPIISEDDHGDSFVRIISSGAEVYDISPATGAGGDIIIHEINNIEDIVGDDHNVSQILGNVPHIVANRRKGATWVSRRGYEGELFGKVEQTYKQRTSCIIAVSGEPSTTVASVLITVHYEVQPTFGFSSQFTSSSNKGRVSNTAQSMSNKILQASTPLVEGGKQAFSSWFKAKAKQYATKAIKASASAVGAYFGGPAGGSAVALLTDQIPELD